MNIVVIGEVDEAYETPLAVEVGTFAAATNGTNRNNNADETEYRE